ncbi:MAG TPA: hypothetical protein DEF39_00270 [Hungateiclostridium thermocellum]|uniref:Uncharacterized protein n=1 Tax=Acetivibrio thermocellus (strain ATCC 27405 / DSM 1237 / JCM 9322 / NBRC 103400 / NCIMB 10682 / NRRL B-4536 / VPI 7372) TaxID=203119 RepID=A3DIB7_ACET2|nr:hypothetical protein Cthe_2494 [Acetivibrio thermocellus ATCC 27405]HBW25717.1 hypothetical protein [Acetivibrio thermocellus]
MAVSTFYKSQLVETTDALLTKALVNETIEVTQLNITKYADSITVEMALPPDLIVTRIDFLDSEDNIITSITGIEIDTAVTTIFSHNIQFVQGGA